MVLPIYKGIQQHLQARIAELDLEPEPDRYNLRTALQAALKKLDVHHKKAMESHFPLLAAGKWFVRHIFPWSLYLACIHPESSL